MNISGLDDKISRCKGAQAKERATAKFRNRKILHKPTADPRCVLVIHRISHGVLGLYGIPFLIQLTKRLLAKMISPFFSWG